VQVLGVVLDSEPLQQDAGMRDAPEVLFVEALVAQPPVERLAKSVLPRLAGLDVECGRADLFEPVHDLGCDELAAVVTSDHGRRSVVLEQPLQHALDDARRDRAGAVHGECDACELVDDREHFEHAARRGRVIHDVVGPDVVAVLGLHGNAGTGPDLAAPLASGHGQAVLAPDPLDALAVDEVALAPELAVYPFVAPAPFASSDLGDRGKQLAVIAGCRFVCEPGA